MNINFDYHAKKLLKYLTFLVVFFITLTLTLTALEPFRRQMQTFATMLKPQPERFTELYFEDHTLLPKAMTKDGVYDFSFTVHNLEYITTDYPYRVYIMPEGEELQLLDKGSLTLNHDESRTILESFKILNTTKRAKVVVELTGKKQMIHFWMEGEENDVTN